MSLLCVAGDCGVDSSIILPNYHDQCAGDVLRKFGISQFVLVRCDYQFADLMSLVEWGVARDDGNAAISPMGIVSIDEPTQEPFEIDGCRRQVVAETLLPVNYSTYQVDEMLEDYAYWKQFHKVSHLYKIMLVDCNGVFWISDAYGEAIQNPPPVTVTGVSPGLDFSLVRMPLPAIGDNGTHQVWSMQFELRLDAVVCGAYLPGVAALLNTSTTS